MKTFKEFLREAVKHRETIDVAKAQELFDAHCKDCDIKKPGWRGSKKTTDEVFLVQGDKGYRSSSNSSNHYTVIIDEFLPAQGYPKRSASIICTNYLGKGYAKSYTRGSAGGLYAIFPYDGVPIGITRYSDIWESEFKLGYGSMKDINEWNQVFEDAQIPDYSYEDLVQGISETLADSESEGYDDIEEIFRSEDNVEKFLKSTYGDPKVLGVSLITSKDLARGDKGHEIWIGGKCLAIRHDVWQKMAQSDEHEDHEPDPDAEL